MLLNKQSFPLSDIEVVLVDDGSQVPVEARCKELPLNYALKIIRNNTPFGPAYARNRGLEIASGEVILFIDDDILAPSEFLENHFLLQQKKEKVIVRGPIIDIPYGDITSAPPPRLWNFSMNSFCTSNVSVKKKYLLEAGGFDTLFRWWEDSELGLRLKKAGLTKVFSFKAFVYHYKPFPKTANFIWKKLIEDASEKAKSANIYLSKHPMLSVRLKTGIYKLNFLQVKIFVNPLLLKIYKKILFNSSYPYWLRKLCYQFIFSYYYVKELQKMECA